MGKRKEILHLAADEVAIVWPVDAWQHLIMTYETLGSECSDPHDRAYWYTAADYVRTSLEAVPDRWVDD